MSEQGQMNRLPIFGCVIAVMFNLSPAAEDSKKRIPFGYASNAEAAPVAPKDSALDRIEFRGVMSIGGEKVVVLFDTSSSRSTVLKLNESVDGLKVTAYEPENDRVRVKSGSSTGWIVLREAKVVAAAIPAPRPAAQAGQQPSVSAAPGAQPPGANMAQVSDEEVRTRMQRVAEEIRRRRALRRQALQNAQQPNGQPQVPPK